MASLHRLSPFLFLSLSLLMVSPSHSLTCTSQKLTKKYATCTDLSSLSAQLHYTYDATNSSLSVAFLAPATNSWIAWAINPTGVGMVGSQALLALKPESGSIVAKTLNISSYQSIEESKLSFEVWDLSADESSGTMRLFGSVKVPAHVTTLNQVWQVGSSVDGTHPMIHDMKPENRNSMGTLKLAAAGPGPGPGPARTGPGPSPGPVSTVVSSPTPTMAEVTPVAPAAPPPASGAPVTMLKGSIGAVGLVLVSMCLL